jgi:hypothetical protein
MTKVAIVALYALALLGMFWADGPTRPAGEAQVDEGEFAKRFPGGPGRFVAGEAVTP